MPYNPRELLQCTKCPLKIRRDGMATHLKRHPKKDQKAGSVETLFRRHQEAQVTQAQDHEQATSEAEVGDQGFQVRELTNVDLVTDST